MTAGIQAVTVPKWGLSMEEGQVVAWHVSEGAAVGSGDDLLDIETSKIANVVESPATGVLRRIVAQPGETVAVGQLLAVIVADGVDDAAVDAWIAEFQANFVPPESGAGEDAGPQHVEIDGRRLSYLVTGPADSAAVPVLLLHGFGSDAGSWLFNIGELAAERRVYALDLPGHGASAKEVGDGTVATLAGAVAGFMTGIGVPRAHLVGHSLGGAVALELATTQATRVASLVLIAPAGLGAGINGAFIGAFIAGESRRDMKPVLAQLVADAALVTRDMVNDVLKYKRLDGVGAALQTIAAAAFPDGRQAIAYRDRLATLAMPVTVIWGARDAIVPAAHAEGLAANVQVHILPEAGHLPHMEAAAAVNRILRASI
ncbi:MAG: acetoin dehydrogenase dihydrolipoyllysine-residue acetyltransferase subunit [Gammaproteobacteria bacterium]|nr:acetoin dehydrogenase dihydrolipoyllysine-residue acetyltransferase subunit [Gammaproteobacteria bacterium]